MPTPTPPPKIRLSRLRNIGWALWDPIGLLPEGARWDDAEGLSFADEYDAYLIHAASLLRRGTPGAEVVAYLADVEVRHMGLGEREDTEARAAAVVAAILADDRLWSRPEGTPGES